MAIRQTDIQRARACAFFQIDQAHFYEHASGADSGALEERARRNYQTVSTQAFQLGFAMAIFSTVEELKRRNVAQAETLAFADRERLVRFVSRLTVAGLNRYFSLALDEAKHRVLAGYFKEQRAGVLDQSASGLRALFGMQGGELNERQWPFFRYLVFELSHSKLAWPVAVAAMGPDAAEWPGEWYRKSVPELAQAIIADRTRYTQAAIQAHLQDRQFLAVVDQRRYTDKGAGKPDDEIEMIVQELIQARTTEAKSITELHLRASLGIVETADAMCKRLLSVFPTAPSQAENLPPK